MPRRTLAERLLNDQPPNGDGNVHADGDGHGDAWEPPNDRTDAPSQDETSIFQANDEVSSQMPKPFPVENLPGRLQSFVWEQAEAIGIDPVAVALPALVTAAGMIGVKRKVILKPGKSGWGEYPILWGAVVAPSGSAKSPAWEAAIRPAKELEADLFKTWKRDSEQYQALEEKPEGSKPPIRQRAVMDDVTVEKVAELLGDNPPGLLLARDELDGWW
jgi:hypothetical protein